MKSDDKHTLTCVYTGRRTTDSGKVWQRFEMPDGKEMFFKGVRRVYIGHTYKCSAGSISSRPECVYDIKRVIKPEWAAADAVVNAKNAARRSEAKMALKSKKELHDAVEALAPLFKGLSFFDRRALVELLVTKCKKI